LRGVLWESSEAQWMGLEASVMCNCYAQGRTTPPPFPERFFINEAGFPDLRPAEGRDAEQDMQRLYEWLRTCCEHPGMVYASIYIANWPGYMDFLDALEAIGAEHVPTLLGELPIENSGLTKADAAAKALVELADFRSMDVVDTKIFVVNGDTGERLYWYVPEHGGVFIWDGQNGHNIGVDEEGLFIADAWEHSRIIFRARRMEQTLLEPELIEQTGYGRVVYTDQDSEQRFEGKTPIPGKELPWPDGRMRNDEGRFRLEYPRLLRAEEQGITPDFFTPIVESLDSILRASVEMGNPVRWY
jgi:hypothetical protein